MPGADTFKGCVETLFTRNNDLKLLKPVALLFLLNLIDAVVSIGLVRTGVATEANHLMAWLLDAGDLPFLAVKLGMGAFACGVFLYGADRKLARFGVTLALIVYGCVMGLHVGTGLAALGLLT